MGDLGGPSLRGRRYRAASLFCADAVSARGRVYCHGGPGGPRGGAGQVPRQALRRAWTSTARRAFIDRFSRFLAGLLKMGIVQRDFKACNVFVLAGDFRLLDVEDIAFFAPAEGDVLRMLVTAQQLAAREDSGIRQDKVLPAVDALLSLRPEAAVPGGGLDRARKGRSSTRVYRVSKGSHGKGVTRGSPAPFCRTPR